MKKLIVCMAILLTVSGCAGAAAAPATTPASSQIAGNYTDEMKISRTADISPEDGADSVERQGDHKGTPYFNQLDFYNMKSTDTLTILPNFKTIQQSSEWSCGVTAAMMVINYYGKLGDYTEESLALCRPNELTAEATNLDQAIAIFDKVGGFTLETTKDYGERIYEEFTLDTIQNYLKDGVPVMVAWNDWGGHWQAIIGYDTMGTQTLQDDVIIVADPYDTTDHNQDGYGIYPAERFYYNFTMYDFFDDALGNDKLFIAAKPVK